MQVEFHCLSQCSHTLVPDQSKSVPAQSQYVPVCPSPQSILSMSSASLVALSQSTGNPSLVPVRSKSKCSQVPVSKSIPRSQRCSLHVPLQSHSSASPVQFCPSSVPAQSQLSPSMSQYVPVHNLYTFLAQSPQYHCGPFVPVHWQSQSCSSPVQVQVVKS